MANIMTYDYTDYNAQSRNVRLRHRIVGEFVSTFEIPVPNETCFLRLLKAVWVAQ